MLHAFFQVLLVGLGGAVGAITRFLATKALLVLWPEYLGAGTLIVNVLGSFAIGLVMGWATHRTWLTDDWRVFLVPGILGGLTTFSSLAYETNLLARGEPSWIGGAHLLANLVLGITAVIAGDATSKMVGWPGLD